MKTLYASLIVVAAFFMTSCSGKTSKNTKSLNEGTMVLTNTVKDKDAEFIKEASDEGMMEINLAKYAMDNATDLRVKKLASMIVRDHSKANDELRSIASSKNYTLSDSSEVKDDKLSYLQKNKGTDFDKVYVKEVISDHEKDMDKFKKQIDEGSDPDLKSFAVNTLELLNAHQDSAKIIFNSLK